MRDALWSLAAERILQLDEVHPRAKDRWLDVWVEGTFSRFNLLKLDYDLVLSLMRKVLPPYWGGDVVLYRGQVEGDTIGMSCGGRLLRSCSR
jgi:hypothetical protein